MKDMYERQHAAQRERDEFYGKQWGQNEDKKEGNQHWDKTPYNDYRE